MQTAELTLKLKPQSAVNLAHPLLQEMDLVFHGDPMMIAHMVAGAMGARQEIAFSFVSGVLLWCEQNRIEPGSLKDMLGKGPVTNPGPIIQA